MDTPDQLAEIYTFPSITSGNGTHNKSDCSNNITSETRNITCPDGTEAVQMTYYMLIHSFVWRFYMPVIVFLGVCACVTTNIVLHRGALRSSSSIYIRAITTGHLVSLFLCAINVMQNNSRVQHRTWKSFYSFYVAYMFPVGFISTSFAIWSTLAFAVERLVVIYRPLKSRGEDRETMAKKTVVVLFLMAILLNTPRFLVTAVTVQVDPNTNQSKFGFEYTELGRNPVHRQINNLIYGFAVFIAPVPLLAVLTGLLLLKLRRAHVKRKKLEGGNENRTNHLRDSRQVQVERVLVASLFGFVVCNTLVAGVVFTVVVVGNSVAFSVNFASRFLFLLSDMLFFLNPLLNFILYVCCSKILREAVMNLFNVRCFMSSK